MDTTKKIKTFKSPLIDKTPQFWDNLNEWVVYWRLNIHKFIIEYLGVGLHRFQILLVYMMDSPYCHKLRVFVFFASRGLGKSFLSALYAISKAILYPGITIKIASATMQQAQVITDKIDELRTKYPNIENEIKKFYKSKDRSRVLFKNGSIIETVVSGSGSRGGRAQILILDESRLMNQDDVNGNLRPFLTGRRSPPFAKKEKYKKYIKREANGVMFLTSIGYKEEWSYYDFMKYAKFIANGDESYNIVSMPYQFGVEAGIIGDDYIEKALKEEVNDPKLFKMEMCVIPYGEAESSMFKYGVLDQARKLRVPLIPPSDAEYAKLKGDLKEFEFYQEKGENEVRVISMDIAVASGRTNDNTVFCVFRLVENGDYYQKELAYIEVMNGVNLDMQILRLKQLFYDLECDYAVIDAGGALGINAANSCGEVTNDIYRGKSYPGWKTMNRNAKFDVRVSDRNAVPVLYCIQVSGASASAIQYNMLVIAQLEFERNRLMLLCSDRDVEDDLNKRYGYLKLKTSLDHQEKDLANRMIVSHLNTNKLIDEAINTSIKRLPSGRFTFDEKGGRKDRIIAMIYGLHFISSLEEDLVAGRMSVNISDYAPTFDSKPKATVRNPFFNNMNKLGSFGRRR